MRPAFLVLALFWVTMNVLLWRSEYGGRGDLGNSVPVEVVWEKILTAPDDSALEISQEGRKIGYCRWMPNIGEELGTGKVAAEEGPPEGMIKKPTSYSLHLEGSFLSPETRRRIRFGFHGLFSALQTLQDFSLHTVIRPLTVQLKTISAEQRLEFTIDDGAGKWSESVGFDELQNPVALAQRLGVPLPPLLLGALPASLNLRPAGQSSKDERKYSRKLWAGGLDLKLAWEARSDWLKIGHSRVRVYRLATRWIDRQEIVILVSRVGEILRVELPQKIVLLNEAFLNL